MNGGQVFHLPTCVICPDQLNSPNVGMSAATSGGAAYSQMVVQSWLDAAPEELKVDCQNALTS